jgi:hypothetical protein
MDIGRILKWIVVIAVVFVLWKVVLPRFDHGPAADTATSGGTVPRSCPAAATRASDAWGSGLSRFVNPPYDVDAWSIFRSEVESKIAQAETACACIDQSCEKTRTAMHELRSLISDMDTSIRNGSPPPSDAVQRQESIDRQIEAAAELVRGGK